ncbi:MAG: heavy metal translocating P-type ATPase, partial [Geminicoccaceae bacterium]|nr:heavy metal translocating P-type ATPase [Geminicoccaceae bacterium]
GKRAFCGVTEDARELAPELWLARPGRTPVRFAFADVPRADAAAVVRALKERGLEVELLSGDRAPVVAGVAQALGIDDWRAGFSPADKSARLEELAGAGRRVLMVGDGLNDAPALAAAHVSLSPSSAVDISQVLGFATPLLAALCMSGSSLLVVGNALRLGRGDRA